jgi:hypothetical protein
MMLFASWIKHPFDVAVQCLHDADAREHCRAAVCCDEDQGFHCSLPLWRVMLGLWQLRDVVAGILQRDELMTVGPGSAAGPPSLGE